MILFLSHKKTNHVIGSSFLATKKKHNFIPHHKKKQSQNSNHDPNVVKERLRKKLDAKK